VRKKTRRGVVDNAPYGEGRDEGARGRAGEEKRGLRAEKSRPSGRLVGVVENGV